MVYLQTTEIKIVKTILEVLKHLTRDINLIVSKKSIKIKTLDISHSTLLHLKLHTEKFDVVRGFDDILDDQKLYYIWGVSTESLTKIVNFIPNDCSIAFEYCVSQKNRLKILSVNTNFNDQILEEYHINLSTITEESFKVPSVNFDKVFQLNAEIFQRMCSVISKLGEVIEFRTDQDKIYVSGEGDHGKASFTIQKHCKDLENQSDFTCLKTVCKSYSEDSKLSTLKKKRGRKRTRNILVSDPSEVSFARKPGDLLIPIVSENYEMFEEKTNLSKPEDDLGNSSAVMMESHVKEHLGEILDYPLLLRFKVKNLLIFCKSCSPGNSIQIHLKKDYPLIAKYKVGVLGVFSIVIAPHQIENETFSD